MHKTHAHLCVKGRVKSRNTISSRRPQRVSELIIQLGANATTPSLQHGIPEANIRPAVPTHNRRGVERSSRVLRVGDVVAVCEAEAVSADAVLVVDELWPRAIGGELVAGLVISTMARGRNADDSVALGEDNDVLPVVAVTTEEASANGLVLLEVVFIHDGAVAVVAALARVGVAILQLGRVTAVSLRRSRGALARVGEATGVNSGGVVATVAVEV